MKIKLRYLNDPNMHFFSSLQEVCDRFEKVHGYYPEINYFETTPEGEKFEVVESADWDGGGNVRAYIWMIP